MEKRISEKQILGLILVFFAALAIRWLIYCWSNSVNLLFWDQWDFYQPYFKGQSLWEMFRRQHGPHRQGLGGLTIYGVAWLTNWNTRWEAIHVAVIQILTVALALGLKWRLTRKWSIWDLLIPLVFLSFSQYELPVLVANPSHGYLPNLLLMCAAHAMLIRRDVLRAGVLSGIFFVLIHTGFGFLSVPVFLIYFIHEILERKKGGLLGLVMTFASIALFLYGHAFETASPCDPKAVLPISQYLNFFVQLFNRVFGNTRMNLWLFLILGLFISTASWFVSELKPKRITVTDKVLFSLLLYSFTLAVVVTKVRTCVMETAPVRYVPFLLPAVFAMVVFLQMKAPKKLAVLSLSLLALIAAGFEIQGPDYFSEIKMTNERKRAWSECWLKTENFDLCKKQADFEPYPMSVRVSDRIKYLKEHRLNLYTK